MSKLQTNAIRHLGSSVDNMTFDSSGRILTPNQPRAFVSYSGGNTTAAGMVAMPFDTVITNIGGCYNNSNYRFTCPVAGVYRFSSWGMKGDANTNNYNIVLYKNGAQHTSITGYNYAAAGYAHTHATYLVQAAVGDYFQFYHGGGAGYYGSNLNGATYELVG